MNERAAIRPYPVPVNEAHRLRTIEALNLEARGDDPFFRHVTAMAKRIMGTPVAFLSLIGGEEQRFLHMDGTAMTGTPRAMSLCAFTVATKRTIVIPDTHLDPRSVHHPIVVNPPHLRFSASVPVILTSGFCIGTLCAVDLAPGPAPDAEKVAQLEHLAAMVARYYEVPLEPDPAHAAQLGRIAQEAQEEFLSLVSHELRTPLNDVLGLMQVLRPADGEQHDLLEAIGASAQHLSDVVESILHFSDLRSGEMMLDEAPVDLSHVVGAVACHFRKLAALAGKTLSAKTVPERPRVVADRARLELALGCLVSNFIAHGGNRGQISVCRAPDGALEIEVSDNGAGIPPVKLAAIGRAFEVGARLNERTAAGIGLGLPLTHRIVELHGGELDMFTRDGLMRARIRLPLYRNVTG